MTVEHLDAAGRAAGHSLQPGAGVLTERAGGLPAGGRGRDRIGSSLAGSDGRVSGRTLILMRWTAICGQLVSLAVITLGLHYPMAVGPVIATVAASILVNLVASLQPAGQPRLTERDAALFLGYDVLQLTLLLHLTGGLANPFSLLLLAPLMVAATILGVRTVFWLSLLNQACLTALAVWHLPLPWPEGETLHIPQLYEFGIWLGLSFSSVLFVIYVCRVAEEARRMSAALAATQLGLAREQRLSAVGALAAAAAHELGTPLGTIAVVAKELANDLPKDSPLAEDVALLLSQSRRCRDILARLSHRPEGDGGSPFERLGLSVLIESAAAPYHTGEIGLTITTATPDGSFEPILRRRPEIIHGIGNLLHNALQFAATTVTVAIHWTEQTVSVTITDDGPGYPYHVLARIGEPYISTRADQGDHMGLGIFIAQTLLERSGAVTEFANSHGGGARVVVRWQRSALEAGDDDPAACP